ncbi:myosin heavy chain, clone 203 [Tetranychus urticae]|uniref:GRIP domain-containing protein n=1 Tax=Tetranychus urticae TaxID=32264 RepID=T1K9S5_TETUR|nr:myosin heavy chain, clone 203 [Tetranychus urticae]
MSTNTSSNCAHCEKLESIVNKQKDKLATVELRLRDCVRAYKTVLSEKNVILQNLEASKELFAKRGEEEEKRLATLEDSLNELSSICGKYESENIKNQALIEKLKQKCDELTRQLSAQEAIGKSETCDDEVKINELDRRIVGDVNEVRKLNNKWTQTIAEQPETREEPEIVQSTSRDQETQTNLELMNSNHGKQRKTECAIVLPTHREVEIEKSNDSRRGSHGSRASVSETVFTDNDFNLGDSDSRFEVSSVRPSLNSVSMVNQEMPSNSVSLFYVNELARKEIELVETRLAARENECALRELRWKYNVDTFKLQSKVTRLEQQLQQVQSDDTTKPNLTYVRNVLVRFLKTKDKKQRTCMMNALLTALGVDQKEIKL